VVAVYEVPDNETHQYGIVGIEQKGANLGITQMVEKPAKGTSPSNLAISGRYILKPEIFDILATQERGSGGEIQLTDALARLIGKQPFHGFRFEGQRFDCGDKVGFLQANIVVGLSRPDTAGPLREILKSLSI
jgi:UTP--glucose-1-phosphate uridylyltransferase